MIGYLLRRILQAIIVVLGVIIIVFLLARLIPGGEARAVLGAKATPVNIKAFNHKNGFTQPMWVQFWHYLIGLPQLKLGYSYKYSQQVWTLIATRLPKTLVLVGTSTLLALAIAIPLGVVQVVKRNKPSDYALTGISFVLYAMPSFFLGTLLITWFCFDTHLLPVSPPSGASPWAVFSDPNGFVLPVVTLAALTIASFSRYMRSSMLDAMAEDYIRTARAKGASNKRVLYGHALRNALIPIVTLLGLTLPGVVSGAVIVEDVFNYPGMGLLTVQAATNTTVATVLGTTLVITVATVIGSLLADILYVVVDPRIRYGELVLTNDPDRIGAPTIGKAGAQLPVGRGLIDPDAAVEPTQGPAGGEAQSTGGLLNQVFRVFLEHKLAVVSLVFIILVVLFCWVGPLIYHTNQTNQELALYSPTNSPPSGKFPLGTTALGYDELGRLMYGGQASIIVGLLSALVATVVGVIYGAVAGFFGKWLDAVMMRFVDIVLSIPVLFLLIALVAIFHASETLLILVIAAVSWLIPARLVRGETLTLRTREYVQAVRAMGGGGPRIIGRHIIPNAIGTIVVFATFQIATSILILAALGFLGFGIPAPGADWGSMLSNAVLAASNGYWWEIYPVGVLIVLVVVAFNFVGDALRDALEVRTQRR